MEKTLSNSRPDQSFARADPAERVGRALHERLGSGGHASTRLANLLRTELPSLAGALAALTTR